MVAMTLCPFTEPINYVKFIKFVSDAINSHNEVQNESTRSEDREKNVDDFVHLPTSIEHIDIFR